LTCTESIGLVIRSTVPESFYVSLRRLPSAVLLTLSGA
jgi:hypothetical protein